MAQWPFHFLFFLFFFFTVWGRDHLFLRAKLKAAAIWIIHFSNCNTLLETFGLALKAYLMTWSSVSPSQPRGDSNESPERGIWELSLCLAHSLCWGLSPLKYTGLPMVLVSALHQLSSLPPKQSWLTQRLSITISHGWMHPLHRYRFRQWKYSVE